MPDASGWSGHAQEGLSLRAHPERDLFGFQPSAERLATSIEVLFRAAPDRALVLSVEGPWGCGKSSWIDLLLGELGRANSKQAPLEIHYNPWVEGDGRAGHWALLADQIGERLYRGLQQELWPHARRLRPSFFRSARAQGLRVGLVRTDDPHDRLFVEVEAGADPRLPWRELAWRISHAVGAADWDPSLALFADPHSRLIGRGMQADEGLSWAGRLAAAAAMAPISPTDATSTAGEALAALARARRQAAEVPPPESARFLELLNRLLSRLGPLAPAGQPRLVIVLEDLGRLGDEAFLAAIRSLTWLVRLHGALIILALDQDQAQRLLPGPAAHGREEALARLIHLRQPVPRVSLASLAPLVEAFLEARVPGLADEGGTLLARTLVWMWWKTGVQTPRMVKRGLTWLDARLSGTQAPTQAAGILAVGALMPWQWGLVSMEALLRNEALRTIVMGLSEVPRNPLTGSAWRVRSRTSDGGDEQRHAVGSLRLLELANEHGSPRDVLSVAELAAEACRAEATRQLFRMEVDVAAANALLDDIQTTALLTGAAGGPDPVEDLRTLSRISARD